MKRQKRTILTLAVCLGVWLPIASDAAALNYAAQLPDVLVTQQSLLGKTVYYRVFDPGLGIFVEGTKTTTDVLDLVNQDGVVIWNYGSVYYARFYDPQLRLWMEKDVNSARGTDLSVSEGMAVWSSGSTVHQLVYDLSRHAWQHSEFTSATPVTGLQTSGGLAAWNGGSRTIYVRAYNPVTGLWVGSSASTSSTSTDLRAKDGIVAGSSGTTVYVWTFDPAVNSPLGPWIGYSRNTGAASLLQVNNGVVAWTAGTTVYFVAYDPKRAIFSAGEATGPGTDMRIQDGTVIFSGPSLVPTIRGYNVESGVWIFGRTPPHASFGVSACTNSAPKTIYFYDRSLGASGWGWAFGTEGIRFEKSSFFTFQTAAAHQVTLTVNAPHGAVSQASLLVDLTSPTDVVSCERGANANSDPLPQGYQFLEATQNEEGLLQITLTTNPGQTVELQASPTVSSDDWQVIATLTNDTGSLIYVDPNSAGVAERFYRSRTLSP